MAGKVAIVKGRLEVLETVIRKGQEAFLTTAEAVYEIGRDNLYAPEFESLADYCLARWDWSANDTSRYKNAGLVITTLKEAGVTVLPANEGQCRELTKIGGDVLVKTWGEVVEQAEDEGKRITAAMIRDAVAKATGKTTTRDEAPSQNRTTEGETTAGMSIVPSGRGNVSAVVTVVLDEGHADAMSGSGFDVTDLGDGSYQITMAGESKAEIVSTLAKWNVLAAVAQLMISFN
jgi:hypothetical protein